jgi:hypothetical protein
LGRGSGAFCGLSVGPGAAPFAGKRERLHIRASETVWKGVYGTPAMRLFYRPPETLPKTSRQYRSPSSNPVM